MTASWTRRIAAVGIITVTFLLSPARAEQAVQLTYEPQVIDVGINPVLFSASSLFTVSVQNTLADGEIFFQSRSGESLTLQIIAAKQLAGGTAQRGKPLLIVAEDVEGEALAPPAERFVLAVVIPSAVEVGCDLWDFIGSTVSGIAGGDRLRIEVQSTRTRVKHDFPRHDFGQVPVATTVFAPPQTVEPVNRDDRLDFGAAVDFGVDNQAAGLIYAPLSERGAEYRCCFGAVFPDAVVGYHLFLVGVLPGTRDTDGLLRATVSPLPKPECQIWDLVNGETRSDPRGRHTALFDAESIVVFR